MDADAAAAAGLLTGFWSSMGSYVLRVRVTPPVGFSGPSLPVPVEFVEKLTGVDGTSTGTGLISGAEPEIATTPA
jgi:hypothetical protein